MSGATSPAPRRSVLTGWLVVAAMLTAAFVLLVVTDAVPALRGPAPYPPEWQWRYLPLGQEPLEHLLPPAVLLALYLGAVAIWAGKKLPPKVAVGLAVLFLSVWQAVPTWMREGNLPDALLERVYSPVLNGYFIAPAQVASVTDTLRHYPEAMATFFAMHPKTHPPGLFLFYAAFNEAAAWLEPVARWFAPMARRWAAPGRDWPLLSDDLILSAFVTACVQMTLTSLAPLALYAMLRHLFAPAEADDTATWSALALPLLAPLSHFWLQWDTVYPTLGLAAWAIALRGQNRQRMCDGFGAGLLLGLLTWLSFGMLAFVALVGLHLFWREVSRWRAGATFRAAGFVALGSGLALPWLLAFVAWGMNPFSVLRVALGFHYAEVTARREAGLWRWMNLVDFAFWLGPGILLLGIVGSLRLWRQGGAPALATLAALFWCLLLALDLSGTARGEAGRLWLFLMPYPLALSMAWPWHNGQRLLILLLMALTNVALAYAIAPLFCC